MISNILIFRFPWPRKLLEQRCMFLMVWRISDKPADICFKLYLNLKWKYVVRFCQYKYISQLIKFFNNYESAVGYLYNLDLCISIKLSSSQLKKTREQWFLLKVFYMIKLMLCYASFITDIAYTEFSLKMFDLKQHSLKFIDNFCAFR